MTDTAWHYRSGTTDDEGGGSWRTWQRLADLRQVQITEPSDADRLVAAKEGVEFTHLVRVPLGTDLRRGDRIIWKDRTIQIDADLSSSQASVLRLGGSEQPWREPTT